MKSVLEAACPLVPSDIVLSYPEVAKVTEQTPRLQKIKKLSNFYCLPLPGDKSNKPTGFYYALIQRGRKQFR